MIPKNGFLTQDFEVEEQPSKTYKMHLNRKFINGYADELEALKQAIFKILNTERYQHIIYSWNYGIELIELIGKPIPFVLPELKRRITEALMQDDRIQAVNAFSFEVDGKKVHVRFTVQTIFGNVDAEKVVDI